MTDLKIKLILTICPIYKLKKANKKTNKQTNFGTRTEAVPTIYVLDQENKKK